MHAGTKNASLETDLQTTESCQTLTTPTECLGSKQALQQTTHRPRRRSWCEKWGTHKLKSTRWRNCLPLLFLDCMIIITRSYETCTVSGCMLLIHNWRAAGQQGVNLRTAECVAGTEFAVVSEGCRCEPTWPHTRDVRLEMLSESAPSDKLLTSSDSGEIRQIQLLHCICLGLLCRTAGENCHGPH